VSAPRIIVTLAYIIIGWAICAATMRISKPAASLETALIAHAIDVPIFFAIVSLVYFKKFNSISSLWSQQISLTLPC